MADIHTRTVEQQLLPASPSAQMHHSHQLGQLQRSASAVSDQDGVFSSSMDTGSSLVPDWIQPPSDFNNLTSLGFDSMFQFSGQPDPFPIDHTEFTSNDFGLPSGMAGPISSIFDASPNSMLVPGNSLENGVAGGSMDSSGFHGNGNSSNGDSSMAITLGHTGNGGSGHNSFIGSDSADTAMIDQNGAVNLDLALKPHYMKSLKASAAAAAAAAMEQQQHPLRSQHHQQQQQQQSHAHAQGFNPAQMEFSSSESGPTPFSSAPLSSSQQQQPIIFPIQHHGEGQPQPQLQSQQQPFAFQPQQSFIPQQQQQQSSQLEEDAMSQHALFGQSRPLSMSGLTAQQQPLEDMVFQQQHQLSHDMKGHFRHASTPNLSELIKQDDSLRIQRQQLQFHHQQESSQISQQQHQQSMASTSIHPFSVAPSISSKMSIAPTRTVTKRPSDLHVDISGRSSSFRLSGDVRNGDFRFGTEGRDPSDSSISAPLSPTNGCVTAPLTPAFFSPAFGEALGSPGSILYQNSPFILGSQDRSRASIQTDTSMGSFIEMHASSASSPSSLGSLSEVGHRMFRASADSMHPPVETVTPMDIACNFDMSGDMSFIDKQDITSSTVQTSSISTLQHRDSICHSPDHIDPHSVEVNPSFFATAYQEEQTTIKMETASTPEIDHDHDVSRSIFSGDGPILDAPITPTGNNVLTSHSHSHYSHSHSQSGTTQFTRIPRKRRSNEGVSRSPSASSPSNSSSPPRPARSRTISSSSSLVDEKEEIAESPRLPCHGSAASLKPIMLSPDLKPPSNKTMKTIIKRFLAAKTPAAGGEKSVLILTSKVAQKSYGTEKRFLCPPPTTMLLGGNWWSVPSPGSCSSGNQSLGETTNPIPTPPKMVISICGEAGSQQGVIDWTTTKDDSVTPIVTGKCVSKQLYINDADEKRKKVEVLVKFLMAGDIELGTFASRPIKVISKPSKKRQSIKNMELCIHHGTTISLFNRIRSQTVSTKYLGVSTTAQPSAHAPWNYGNNNLRDWPSLDPLPDASVNPVNTDGGTCFVARTGSWDPFVVWIVTPGQTRTETLQEHFQRHPGFPPPPAIAINSPPENGPQTPIHYNQPIVLQCLSTGLVSPVMVIRKVDKGSMVLGGGSSGQLAAEYDQEAIGDPVSQLHKVAFQITGQSTSAETSQSKLQQGTYLACLGDVVGMQRANEGKRYLPDTKGSANCSALTNEDDDGSSNSGNSTTQSSSSFAMDIVPEIPEGSVPEVLMSTWSEAANKAMRTGAFGSAGGGNEKAVITTADGHKVERKRRVSSSVVIKPTGGSTKAMVKSRRRVNSMSVTQAEAQRIRAGALAANSQYHQNPIQVYVSAANSGAVGSTGSAAGAELGKDKLGSNKETGKVLTIQQQRRHSSIWTEDVTDAAVWTIVGTDCAQYNFCTPGGNESMSLPRSPVTAVPMVLEICLNGHPFGSRASVGPIYINSTVNTTTSSGNNSGGSSHHSFSKNHGNKALRVMESHQNNGNTYQQDGSFHHHQIHHHQQHHRNSNGGSGTPRVMTLKGHGFSRDLSVWFGTIKAPVTEYQSPESMVVHIPPEVTLKSSFYFRKDDDDLDVRDDEEDDEGKGEDEDQEAMMEESDKHLRSTNNRFRRKRVKGSQSESDCIPMLLVRTDGVIYRSGHSIALGEPKVKG
ncbi:hypothetical protein BX616_011338 [Lobosporangium transversale]|uniref:LAG1-DNAbind-domain-containing protein n=1 Tax=Lobosporangium transversale TaxID=64571 RepID=A0A1Y2H0N8_9FUNG|nr:hypothetical protein BCR41DRAFT_391587 [Lobosporangium transversale]KAF9908926.1 hypothetical protein BX616_011338 [Lobosporangium transversale]ORZ28119.1 hypothetical protein BCR41DRAFT_391587 [Lobosporangium transversale]|eukprot:XP_021885804.1 hypothetical protein BCR41DRAFT_391587 [Lobosporangium transversale]